MNISPNKLKLFERIYVEEGEAFLHGKPFPQELEDEEFIDEYRSWRLKNKDTPLMEEAGRQFHILEAKREQEEKAGRNEAEA